MRLNVCRFVPQILRTGFQNRSRTISRWWGRLQNQLSFIVSPLSLKGSVLRDSKDFDNSLRYI